MTKLIEKTLLVDGHGKRTQHRSDMPWLRLLVLFTTSSLAGGLFPCQAKWINILAEQGVFSSFCEGGTPCDTQNDVLAGIFGTMSMGSLIFTMPLGITFDKRGAKFVGIVGAVSNFCGYIVLLIPIYGASQGLDRLTYPFVFPSILLTELGMMMSSYGLIGMTFHFPGHQTAVLSLNNSCNFAAAFLPVLLSAFLDRFKYSFLAGMMLLTVFVAVAIPGAMLGVDKREFNLQAQRTLGLPMPQVRDQRFWSKTRHVLKLFAHDIWTHLGMLIVLTLSLSYLVFYQTQTSAYSIALFGKARGNDLASFSASALGFCAIFLGPLCSHFADMYGTPSLLILSNIFLILSVAYCNSSSMSGQQISQLCAATAYAVLSTAIQKHVMCYIPSTRFGMASGIWGVLIGVVLMVAVLALSVWSSTLNGLDQFSRPLLYSGACSAVSTGIFCVYYVWVIPEQPVLLPEDEQEISQMFGCGSLTQVEKVTDLPRRTVLKLLSKSDSLAVRELLDRVKPGCLLDIIMKSNPPFDQASDEGWNGQSYLACRLAKLPDVDARVRALGPQDLNELIACTVAAFNGTEPAGEWILGPSYKGDLQNPKRMSYFQKMFGFLQYIHLHYGAVLGLFENGVLVGAAAVYPPGRLLKNSYPFQVGGHRYVSAVQALATLPPFVDPSLESGMRLRQAAAFSDFENLHIMYVPGPHWYVATLGVHPNHHGKGLGKHLLAAVSAMADEDHVPCYLETSGDKNVQIYTRCGYKRCCEHFVEVDDSAHEAECSKRLAMSLMLRKACN